MVISIGVMDQYPDLLSAEDRQDRVKKIADEISDPPVLSTVGMNLIYELRQKETSVKKLSEIISAEPLIAAKVLRYTNSAYTGLACRIQSIRHAITMLGLEIL